MTGTLRIVKEGLHERSFKQNFGRICQMNVLFDNGNQSNNGGGPQIKRGSQKELNR